MTAWDINAAEAMGVVQRAAGTAKGYQAELTGIETAVTELVGVLPNSQLVQTALGEFSAEVVTKHLSKTLGHTNSALQGTAQAVTHYHEGQLEMAATAQGNAALAEYPEQMPGRGGDGATGSGPRRGN